MDDPVSSGDPASASVDEHPGLQEDIRSRNSQCFRMGELCSARKSAMRSHWNDGSLLFRNFFYRHFCAKEKGGAAGGGTALTVFVFRMGSSGLRASFVLTRQNQNRLVISIAFDLWLCCLCYLALSKKRINPFQTERKSRSLTLSMKKTG